MDERVEWINVRMNECVNGWMDEWMQMYQWMVIIKDGGDTPPTPHKTNQVDGWMDEMFIWMDGCDGRVVGLDCIKSTSTLSIVVLQRQEWMAIDCWDGCCLRRVDWMRIESCRGPFPSPVWRCQVQFGDAESSLATLDLSSVELQFGEKTKNFHQSRYGLPTDPVWQRSA